MEDNNKNLKKLIYNIKEAQIRERNYNKIFSYNNIISKNILLRNMKFNKIISYNFNSTAPFYPATSKNWTPFESAVKVPVISDALPLGESTLTSRETGANLNSYIYKNFNNKKEGIANTRGNIYIKDTYKLLFYLFKSMYCLISKPVLNYTNDKVTIQLFYYLNIPKKKVFRLFSISYINSIKKKWLAPPRTPILPKGWKDGLYPTRPPMEDGFRDKAIKEASQIFTGGWAFLATLGKSKPEGSYKPQLHRNPSFSQPLR